MKTRKISRRQFIKTGTTLSATAGIMLSTANPVFSLPAATGSRMSRFGDYKALVFIMLDGGNDSFNMLVPVSERHYQEYRNSRSNMALPLNRLLPLNGFQDQDDRRFGLHPNMKEVRQLFDLGKLSFVANVGPMTEPVSKASFYKGDALLPLGLLSHSDQFNHWQTSRPHERTNSGWFGRLADQWHPRRPLQQIPMNISLSGNNIMQSGARLPHYSINQTGSVGLEVNEEPTPLNRSLLASFEKLLNENYPEDPFKMTYLSLTRQAQMQHDVFKQAANPVQVPMNFSSTPLSRQLRMVAKTIGAAEKLGLKRQTFFIRYGGWDHHDELLNNQAEMLGILSKALGEFQSAIESMGLSKRVVTFTGSDFGRTLTSNGNGTDHGWGGNTMIMGEALQGGKIFGQYPSLSLGDNNPLDAGDGVIIPTTSIDQLNAALAKWFGVEIQNMQNLFPNLKNFGNNTLNILS